VKQNFGGAPRIQVFLSNPTTDGWILESGETTSQGGTMNSIDPTLRVGDDAARKEYISIVSFHTNTLPDNALIDSVTLKLRKHSITGAGDPVKIFQGFLIDILPNGYSGNPALQLSDFTSAAVNIYGPYTRTTIDNFYEFTLTSGKAYINKLTENNGITQIRVRFKLEDNDDALPNYLSLYSGNASATTVRPQLWVRYYLP
jgi:hypothetical protein